MWARTAVPRAPAPLMDCDPADFALRGNAGRRREAALPAEAFREFFRIAYQPPLRVVIFTGGNPHEAEDAMSAAMAEVLQRWDGLHGRHVHPAGDRRAARKDRSGGPHRGRPHDTREEAW